MTIGERIRQRRLELGLTQDELAKKMGYKSRAAISNVEKDKEDLTSTRIRKYADALQTTPAYLMGWESFENIVEDSPVLRAYERIDGLTSEFAQDYLKQKIINNVDPTYSELELIIKFRKLDKRGQDLVMETLNREFLYKDETTHKDNPTKN